MHQSRRASLPVSNGSEHFPCELTGMPEARNGDVGLFQSAARASFPETGSIFADRRLSLGHGHDRRSNQP